LANNKTFRCRLVTPAARVLNDDVEYASVPAWDGLMGFLPSRSPIVARLGIGELTLKYPDSNSDVKGGERHFFLDGGFVQMNGTELTILAEKAIAVEEINVQQAETELREAMAKSVPDGTGDRATRQAALDHDRERARMKLHLAKQKTSI